VGSLHNIRVCSDEVNLENIWNLPPVSIVGIPHLHWEVKKYDGLTCTSAHLPSASQISWVVNMRFTSSSAGGSRWSLYKEKFGKVLGKKCGSAHLNDQGGPIIVFGYGDLRVRILRKE
jgi:hypothetical protein